MKKLNKLPSREIIRYDTQDKEAVEDMIRLIRALMKQLSPADTLTRQAKEMALEVRRLESILKTQHFNKCFK